MRKRDPNRIREEFAAEIAGLLSYLGRIETAVSGSTHEKGDLSHLCQSTFLSGMVAFERFLSDLFLAYLNKNFLPYQNDLRGRVVASVKEKFGEWASQRVGIDAKKHVQVSELEAVLDPDGYNLTFKSANDIIGKANRWFAKPYRDRMNSITPGNRSVIDAASAIRNFIAHESKRSKKPMNDTLELVGNHPENSGLGRGVNKIHVVGAFL